MSDNNEVNLDESILETNETPGVDFSDIENVKETNTTRPAIKTAPQIKKTAEEKIADNLKLEKKEPAVTISETVDNKKDEEIVKKEPDVILEEDHLKKESEKPLTEDTDEEDELLDKLINSDIGDQTPHINIDEIENNITTESSIVYDSESKHEVVVEEKDTEKEEIAKRQNLLTKRTGFAVYGGEDGIPPSFSSDNPMLNKLKPLKLSPDKIKSSDVDVENTEKTFLKQYLQNENSPVVSPRITRFPLLLSGYYAEMINYKYGELAGLVRITRNPELRFLRRFTEELVSLFNHISWTSIKENNERISFDEWVEITLLPDLDQFYFGGFDATYPGDSVYNITCGNCGEKFDVVKKNRDLCYALQNGGDESRLSDKLIKDILLQKVSKEELKKTPVYIKAHELYEEKVIYPNQIKVSYGVPSILDALEWISIFEEILSDEYDDFNGLMDSDSEDHNVLKLYTYIKKITAPVIVGKNAEGLDIVRFHTVDATVKDPTKRLENRRVILKILNNLPKDQFADLFTGKEVAEKVRLIGIQHMLNNIKCPNPECKKNIIRVPINMSDNFFTEAAQTVDRIAKF